MISQFTLRWGSLAVFYMYEIRKCKISGKKFKISEDDIEFYKKRNLPLPTLCPEERQRRRLIWRNERHLYQRNCSLCKKNIISIYSKECEFPIYCKEIGRAHV